jgi:uncharacterized protein (TIGR03083 family)
MTTTTIPIESVRAIDRREAAAIAVVENQRFVDLVRSLRGDDWAKPTDCPAWDVRALVSHVLGAMDANASFREFAHQGRAGKKAAGNGPFIDGMTSVQVRERAHLTPAELVDRVAAQAPRAARGRAKIPALMRRMPMKQAVGGVEETWRVGYLMDIIFTRDTWMHRVDIARATGAQLVLTAEHDGRIVADVVAEWSRRHGRPFTLDLEGPAGGTFTSGSGGDDISLDAVELCRVLSGRANGAGLLTQEVPF